MDADDELYPLAQSVGLMLEQAGLMLVTAESCTGGWLAQCITAVPGSSGWFDRGYVTYSNAAKTEMLGVEPDLIDKYGAVSEQVARAMAVGALETSNADMAIAITGVAGPGGGSLEKPVGTVWMALQRRGGDARTRMFVFSGDRRGIRCAAVGEALQGLKANFAAQ
jgi:nicotinamide-nucleotide amidase